MVRRSRTAEGDRGNIGIDHLRSGTFTRRQHVIRRVPIDIEVVRIDAGIERLPVAHELQHLPPGADGLALHQEHVRLVEGVAARFGGEEADFDALHERRIRVPVSLLVVS